MSDNFHIRGLGNSKSYRLQQDLEQAMRRVGNYNDRYYDLAIYFDGSSYIFVCEDGDKYNFMMGTGKSVQEAMKKVSVVCELNDALHKNTLKFLEKYRLFEMPESLPESKVMAYDEIVVEKLMHSHYDDEDVD